MTGTPTQAVYQLVNYTGAAPATVFSVTNLPAGYQLEMARGGKTVALVKASGFDQWATTKGVSGAMFHTDGNDRDSIATGVEYALGLNPVAADTLPVLAPVSNGFTLTLPKGTEAAADPKIGYFHETSTDLVHWVKTTPTSQNGTSFSYTLPNDAPARFVRVRIEQTP